MAKNNYDHQITITCNATAPQEALKLLNKRQKEITKDMSLLNQAVAADKKQWDSLNEELKAVQMAIDRNKKSMEQYRNVITNLSNATGRQLRQALRQLKKDMATTTDSAALKKMQQDYNAINRQIKILEGSLKNIEGEMGNLKGKTTSWLQSAIQQQRQYIASMDNVDAGYQKQLMILRQLEAEETRRAAATVSSGTANASQLAMARQALLAQRSALPQGAAGSVEAQRIEQINALLKQCDAQIAAIEGKAQQLPLTTQQVEQKLALLTKDLKTATPEQLRRGLQACREQLDKIAVGSPKRKQWVDWAKQLETALKGVDKEAGLTEKRFQEIVGSTRGLRGANMKELQQAAARLNTEMQTLNRRSKEYTDKQKQLQAIRNEINKTTGAVQKQGGAFQTTLRNLTAYFGLFQLFSKIQQMITSVFKLNLRFSDQLANVRKVSGLTMKEIDTLAEHLAKIDTRTTIEELNDIAYAGAKLGFGNYGIQGLEEFTRAANVVNVALKEDLGDEALTALSKFVEVMGLIPKLGVEQSMLKAGSAIFKLSSTSTATGKNIIEFTKRLMGMADQAGITADQLLALGSAADSMALMPEVASTAFNLLITAMQTQHNLIENALGINKGTISDMFEAGKAMDAIVLVLEKMKEKGNINAIGKQVFKDLGGRGSRLVNVLTTMSQKVDMLKSSLQVSADAFQKGTAVVDEYNIQQETANALMQRASNMWEKAFVNPKGVDTVYDMAQAWYDMTKYLTESTYWMSQAHLLFKLLAFSIQAVIALLPTLIEFLLIKGVVSGWQALVTVYRSLTVSIEAATTAQLAMNKATKTNIYTFLASVILSLGVAIYDYATKTSEAEENQKKLNNALAEAQVEADKETQKLQNYITVLEDVNTTTEERQRIMKQFQQEYGSYISALGIEINTVSDLKDHYDELTRAVRRAAYERIKDKFKEQELDPLMLEEVKATQQASQGNNGNLNLVVSNDALDAVDNFNRALAALNDNQLTAAQRQKKLNLFVAQYGKQLKAVGIAAKGAKLSDINARAGRLRQQVSNGVIQSSSSNFGGYIRDLLESGQANDAMSAYEIVTRRKFRQARGLGGRFNAHGDYVIGNSSGNVQTLAERTDATGRVVENGAFNKTLYNSILTVVKAYNKRKGREDEIDSAFAPYTADDIDLTKSPGALNNDAPDKNAIAEQKRQERLRQKQLRLDLKDEEAKAKAIMDNVKNYYERQITSIINMATESGMDDDLQKRLVDSMKLRMNTALSKVRSVIGAGGDKFKDEWDAFRKTMSDDLFEKPDDDGYNRSIDILDNIIGVNVDELHNRILALSSELNQNGSVLADQIMRKATENELSNAKINNDAFRKRQQYLLERDYTGKVNTDYEGEMETLEISPLSDRQTANLLNMSQKGDKQGIQAMLDERSSEWQTAFENARKNIVGILNTTVVTVNEAGEKVKDAIGTDNFLKLLFDDDYEEAVQELPGLLNMTADQVETFYNKMIEYTEAYTEAQKKAYDQGKKIGDFMFNNRADIKALDSQISDAERASQTSEKLDTRENFSQQMGWTSSFGRDEKGVEQDPEMVLMELKFKKAKEYYDHMVELREQDKISQEQLMDAYTQMGTAYQNMTGHLIDNVKERVSALQTFSQPMADAAYSFGELLGDMISDTDDINLRWQDILKDMLKSYMKMFIQMAAQDVTRRVQQQLYYRQAEADETVHQDTLTMINAAGQTARLTGQVKADTTAMTQKTATDTAEVTGEVGKATGMTMLGISEGAAKIIGKLGWWGIPLIAVISSLLMGLLSWAISAALGSSSKSGNSSSTNTKLVSGMLTYDSGNVQSFADGTANGNVGSVANGSRYAANSKNGGNAPRPVIANDGKVYMAREDDNLGTGLVTEPTTTFINARRAIVGENGPELVVGRETTRAIQMYQPGLMRALVSFDKNYSGRGYRAYDEGNVQDFADGAGGTDMSAISERLDRMDETNRLMAAVLDKIATKGIPAIVQKYGRNGLVTQAADGAEFMRRNSGDRLWQKKG